MLGSLLYLILMMTLQKFYDRYRSILVPLLSAMITVLMGYAFKELLNAEIRSPEKQFITVIWRGSIYSLFALGYALVFSILGVLNLAHGAMFMWGAFLGLTAVIDWKLPILMALPVGFIGGGIVGIIVDAVAFAPLRRRDAPRIAQLISSIGISTIMVNAAQLQFGSAPQRFPRPELEKLPMEATQLRDYHLLGSNLEISISPLQISIFIIAIALMLLLQYMIMRTKVGKAMRVAAYNQKIASLLSINVGNVYRFTFFLAGALAGVAGVLYGVAFSSMTPFMGDAIALKGLTVIVLGGMGNIRGAVLGGFVIAAMEVYVIAIGYSWLTEAVVFSALFLILLVRPQGLLGEAEIKRA